MHHYAECMDAIHFIANYKFYDMQTIAYITFADSWLLSTSSAKIPSFSLCWDISAALKIKTGTKLNIKIVERILRIRENNTGYATER